MIILLSVIEQKQHQNVTCRYAIASRLLFLVLMVYMIDMPCFNFLATNVSHSSNIFCLLTQNHTYFQEQLIHTPHPHPYLQL